MTVAYLLKHDKFGSNFVLIKQNLPNSIILPPNNGGFKARSHSVRKANMSHNNQASKPKQTNMHVSMTRSHGELKLIINFAYISYLPYKLIAFLEIQGMK